MAAAKLLRSSVFRLTWVATLVLGLAAATAVALIGWHANRGLTLATQTAIERDAADLRRALETGGMEALTGAVQSRAGLSSSGLYWLSDRHGHPVAGNLEKHPAELNSGRRTGTFTYRTTTTQAREARDGIGAGVLVDVEGGGTLVVARDVEGQRALLSVMYRDLALGLGGLAFLGVIGGLLLARHILGRIEAMSAASEAIMAGNFAGRIPRIGSGDELDRLADHLNEMLDRIERLMAGLREVSDNIAHDLKTPLNRLRNRAEQALGDQRGSSAWREGLERTIEEADELIKTFNALLLIARLEAGAVEDSLAIVDVVEIVRGLVELYEPVAEDAGLRIVTNVAVPVHVRANRQLIGQAVANLMDNAIKYAKQTGPVGPERMVTLDVTASHDWALISVGDRGPGIREADRKRALQRFVRLDPSRTSSGTGLGLSLVAAVVHMHRGSIRLEDNAPGLRVVLVLPLVKPQATVETGPVPGTRVGDRKVEA